MTEDYGRRGWNEQDLRFHGLSTLKARGVMSDHDIITPEQMERSLYYQDFLARHKRKWFAGVGFEANGDVWCLSIRGRRHRGPFQPSELDELKALWRPLTDAATLARLMDKARLPAVTSALEAIGHAAIICDERGNIRGINAMAEALVGSMLDPRSATLNFRDPLSASAFDGLLKALERPTIESSTRLRCISIRNHQRKSISIRGSTT